VQALEDVGGVDAVRGDDLQDEELEKSPPDAGKPIVQTHDWRYYLARTR
jgi:hypothetical protein